MSDMLELMAAAAVIGIGGAACMDVWALGLRRGLGIPTLDYALLGRWVGHMRHGRLRHDRIGASPPVRGERLIGWMTHYAIGIAFALALLAVVGPDWLRSPTIAPALAVGLGTIVGPWLVMQPGMGAGIAGSRTPNPRATRIRNLGSHAVYGLGLWLTALSLAVVG